MTEITTGKNLYFYKNQKLITVKFKHRKHDVDLSILKFMIIISQIFYFSHNID